MKKFDIPDFYRSPIISEVKARRKAEDPRKKDFSPSLISFGKVEFLIARHFGFCYGVENAIEIAYRAIKENPGKRIFLLSQMIHNPGVNEDLQSHGIEFIQDTHGKQLIPWNEIRAEDIVIIPAFGTTLETENILSEIGVDVQSYNTTCPFVEKVWNRSAKLGNENHTIIIHGKADHEETRATFSHSNHHAPSLVIRNMEEAHILCEYILGKRDENSFYEFFQGKYSEGFDFKTDLNRLAVVNQTTMLASETQAITETIRDAMQQKYGEEQLKDHMADTRDTLCYATNDNQSATYGLLEHEADLAIVIGGYNSSNTSHLVELLEEKFVTYFIKGPEEITNADEIHCFNIHSKQKEKKQQVFPMNQEKTRIVITSGASCPDAVVDRVIQRINELYNVTQEMHISTLTP
ncbi:MAG: 4-hydroxy-3-methylbut-2-enyl diphosphate reductase [Bacteroidetes bacterium]|nr:MAG: 4-hydroxy-3-methylbut-2-enyl diphosphate reductase [Bacteroidota bacterium]